MQRKSGVFARNLKSLMDESQLNRLKELVNELDNLVPLDVLKPVAVVSFP